MTSINYYFSLLCLADITTGKIVRTEFFYCKRGISHGFYRALRHDNTLESFGVYINGHPSGVWWRSLTGNGYYFGEMNKNLEFEGPNNCFIYPDFETVLMGLFECDVMRKASETRIETISVSEFGVLVPHYFHPSQTAIEFYLEKPDETVLDAKISDNPTIADPYESEFVQVRPSMIENAGEGLFSKRKIPKGNVVAYFNGIRISSELYTESSDYSISTNNPVNTNKSKDGHQNNKDEDCVIMFDIPDEYRSTTTYCATLAHKICHSFQPNAIYDYAFHPRFGFIRCAVALRDINEDEEITCDYKYSLTKHPPKWYMACLNKHLMEVLNLNEDEVQAIYYESKSNTITVIDS